MFTRSIAALLLTVTAAAPLVSQQPSRTEVPVRSVMLFSSGVGYFEHAGTVRGEGTTELRFKTSQINDILKSLVLQDEGGGHVTNITYPSMDPVDKTLRSFQVDITANPSMADLLNQLRGAKVTIQWQAEKFGGTILGVEMRAKATDKNGEPIQTPVLNVLLGGMIRSIDLPSITSLTFDDPQLQDELAKALSALNQARDQDKKPVVIGFAGNGERRVRIGYVVESPIWKTSYRLLLDEKSAKLQGWAIVENQTESDWNNVSLSLVSGRPISFIMDLYQPLYATRPTVVQDLFAGLHPQLYAGGIASLRDRVDFGGMGPAGAPAPASSGAAGGRGGRVAGGIKADALNEFRLQAEPQEMAKQLMDATSSVQSIASAAKMGELFQYTIQNVTLARQKSAMLPIITDSISADRLSIYNASVLATNPLNGVRLKNNTGKHLLQGPITVLDKNSYAGDARIDNLPPGQERLLSYGIDLEMTVDNTKNTQTNSIVTAKIYKGALIIDRRVVSSREYLADNKSDKDKVLVVEHPIQQGWKLVDSPKPYESTQSLYRFQSTALAKKITLLVVKEEQVRSESIAMLPTDIGPLLAYSRTGEIPAAVRDAIVKAIQLKQAVIDTERQMADRAQKINDITTEQNRIRENMRTVGQTTQYYQRLLTKLNEQESSIEKLRQERDDLTKARDTQRKALEDYLAALTIS